MKPGVYIAREDEDDYGLLLAMTVTGEARLLGERYDVDGKKEIAARVGGAQRGELTPNVEVTLGIGAEYFALALKDYGAWKEAWFREAIQNGVDAGAKNISIVVEQQSDGTWLVSCQDDGRGMSEDVLVNKFMQLGGTTKVVGGTTGGFGKAKEILILPWIAYEIHTQDRVLKGAGSKSDMTSAPYLQGTRISVLMAADNATSAPIAQAFIGKCYLPNVKFTVNGEKVKAKLEAGPVLREIEGKLEICHNKDVKDPYPGVMIVRVKNGADSLAMFTMRLNQEIPGQVTIEIVGRSTEILTANRDGLIQSLYWPVQEFANELAVDTKSALRKQKGMIREKYEGSRFRAESRRTEALLLETIGRMEPAGKADGGGFDLSVEQVIELMQALEASGIRLPAEDSDAPRFRTIGPVADVVLHGMSVRGATHMEAIAKQLAWEPAFYLMNNAEGWNVPKKFRPAHMTRQIRLLANLWAEMCRFVMMQLGSGRPFGVGFVFDDQAGAMYARGSGENIEEGGTEGEDEWLLLNPIIGDPRRDESEILSIGGDIKIKRGTQVVSVEDYLYALAVHECTHMADGIAQHYESFSSALTLNIALTANKGKEIRALRKAINAQEKETAERLRAEKPAREPRAPKPKKVPLFNLADRELERERRRRARGYDSSSYISFKDDHSSVWDSMSDLERLISEVNQDYETIEIRDARGNIVWRSPKFSQPMLTGLSPLRDEHAEIRRRDRAVEQEKEYHEKFSVFRNYSDSLWSGGSDLKDMIRQTKDDVAQGDYFEIRDAHGNPVWRSENFEGDVT